MCSGKFGRNYYVGQGKGAYAKYYEGAVRYLTDTGIVRR